MRTAGGAPAGAIVAAATELASRSASRRAPSASVPGASTANSVAPRRPITSDSRAAALIACTERRRFTPPGGSTSSASTMQARSEEHTSELQSLAYLVCRLLLEKKKTILQKQTASLSTPVGSDAHYVYHTL